MDLISDTHETASRSRLCAAVRVLLLAVALCDPAGKAAAQETESSGKPAPTADEIARELANPKKPLASLTLKNQLRLFEGDLPTADTARAALSKGGVIACPNPIEAARVSDAIAPEHLQLSVAYAGDLVPRLNHYGALFIGERSAEVFGDYGVGPNHVLPTSGTSRARGGLSVMDFLRVRTWIRLDGPGPSRELVEDSAWLARQEGLEAHARAAELR